MTLDLSHTTKKTPESAPEFFIFLHWRSIQEEDHEIYYLEGGGETCFTFCIFKTKEYNKHMNAVEKDFQEWFKRKPKLHERSALPSFSEKEVWMCHLGTNIGFEIDGKKEESLRPIIVFKKLSSETFLAIPLSTKIKNGSWYSPSFIHKKEGRFCLHQIKLLDRKRLKYRIEKITQKEFQKLKSSFQSFLES